MLRSASEYEDAVRRLFDATPGPALEPTVPSQAAPDPLGDGYHGPTRNLASSQVSCVNFLLPLAEVPGALGAFLQCIDEDVVGVEPIVDQGGRSALVELEWVGWDQPLEGGRITRGANQTSTDAVLVARLAEGRRERLERGRPPFAIGAGELSRGLDAAGAWRWDYGVLGGLWWNW